MIERTITDMTSDPRAASAVSGLIGFSEALARARHAVQVFEALAAFASEEGLSDLVLVVRPPNGRGKAERWTTLTAERLSAFESSWTERTLEDLLPVRGRPEALAWATSRLPGLHRVGDAAMRERLLEADLAGGVLTVMELPSGRSVAAYALAAPDRIERVSEVVRDVFLVASIHGFLALDRALGPIPPVDLSRREFEALRFAAQGLSDRQVAAAMNISEPTVKFHLGSVRRKLNARTTKEAIAALAPFWRDASDGHKPNIELT